jgi:glutamate racemase
LKKTFPIGIFDSGYGGLTVMKEIIKKLPQYDYIYLGDNARAPYGPRSFESVYRYTLQCVEWFLSLDCPLVILACNTASAKALRTIQQNDLEKLDPASRVLGVIRPTSEIIGKFTKTGAVGILATRGTVKSESYPIEIEKFYPGLRVYQEACPIWVPLIENNEHLSPGADYFVKKHIDNLMSKGNDIDTILLACTHYPLLLDKIRTFLPDEVNVLSQGEIVADSLAGYLERHPEIRDKCTTNSGRLFYTTDSTEDFNHHAGIFFGQTLESLHLSL